MIERSYHSHVNPVVSVLTPSIPERHDLLTECELSVRSQGQARWEHLVEVDEQREGCAVVMNRLANEAKCKWLLPLADDDLLLPGCLGALLARTTHPITELDAPDIIYSPPLVTGNEDRWWFFQAPPAIPSCALIRAETWHQLGGYDETLEHEEDRDMWAKALEASKRFVRVDEPCWVYRQHAGNKSFHKVAA